MAHVQKIQGQGSVGSKDRVVTDRWTDTTDCSTFPANVERKTEQLLNKTRTSKHRRSAAIPPARRTHRTTPFDGRKWERQRRRECMKRKGKEIRMGEHGPTGGEKRGAGNE